MTNHGQNSAIMLLSCAHSEYDIQKKEKQISRSKHFFGEYGLDYYNKPDTYQNPVENSYIILPTL